MYAMCISVVSSMPFESCQRKKICIPAKISTPQNQKFELFKLKQDIYTYKQGKARQLLDKRSDLYQTLCQSSSTIPSIMPLSLTIPTVDLSPFMDGGDESSREKAMETISDACINLGVFQIENHGVSLDQMDQFMELSKKFFSFSDEEKAEYTENSKPGAGFIKGPNEPYGDFDYLLMFPPEIPLNGVPTNPPDYRETFEEVFKYFLKTAQLLGEIINKSLGLPPNFLECFNYESDYLMAMDYPLATEMGIVEHVDPNILTIILVDDECLEVFLDGKWISVTSTTGKLVVILGSLSEVWSNNKFRRLVHRASKKQGASRNCVNFCYKNPVLQGFRYKDCMVDMKKIDDENIET